MTLEKPNYNDIKDRLLYHKLFYRNNNGKELTKEEQEFVKTMYHLEESACGLG